MRVVPLLALLAVGCRERQATPSVQADPQSSSAAPVAPSASKPALPAKITFGPATEAIAAFDIVGGTVAVLHLAVDCPQAPHGCAFRPDVLAGKPNDLPSLGCAGGRIVTLAFKTPWAKLGPGKYSAKTVPAPDLSVSSYQEGKVSVANDGFDKDPEASVTLDEVTPTLVRGSVHARVGGWLVDGTFRAPVCAAKP